MNRALIVCTLIATLSKVAFADEPCRVEHAQYGMMEFPAFTAGFHTLPNSDGLVSDVAFHIHAAETNETFWFFFDQGNGRHVDIYLYLTNDVTGSGWTPDDKYTGPILGSGSIHYYSADSALRFDYEAPRQGDRAPVYILVPELMEVMWYRNEPRVDAPLAFFKLSGCNG